MSPTSEQITIRHAFDRFRIGNSELKRIIDIASEGFPTSSVSISTNRGPSRLIKNTLEELINAVNNSTTAGNLNHWTDISILAKNSSHGKIISIKINSQSIEMEVSGKDATWTHGQAARLELIIRGANGITLPEQQKERSKARKLYTFYGISWLFSIFILSSLLYLMGHDISDIVFTPSQIPNDQWLFVALTATLVQIAVTISIKSSRMRTRKPIFLVTSKIPDGSLWSTMSTTDRLTVSSLLFGSLVLVLSRFS